MNDLKIGIDQFSINYPLIENSFATQIKNICNVWNFTYLLGDYEVCSAQNGYKNAIGWSDNSIKLMWNEEREDMGIFLYFSATGKRNYELQGSAKALPIEWLSLFRHVSRCNGHLTRIDIAIDIFDADFSVKTIFKNLKKQRLIIKNSKNACINDRQKFFGENGEITGINIGSRSSMAYLRIYDKKVEQLHSRNNPYYNLADNVNEWLRIEAEFKNQKAKSIGIELGKNFENKKLMGFVLNQWNFASENENFWDALKKISNYAGPIPSLEPKSKNYLYSMLRYFLTGGSVGVVYKLTELFGENEITEFLDFIKNYVKRDSIPAFKVPNNARHDIQIMKEEVGRSNLRLMEYVYQVLEEIKMDH